MERRSQAHTTSIARARNAVPPSGILTRENSKIGSAAAIDAKSEIAAQYYEECKTVLKEYDVARVRRDFALLLLKVDKLYRDEYESFAKFVKARTDLSVSQAYKNANRALVLLVFEDAEMLPLVPQGRIADQLVGLPATHWIAAWKDVLQNADGRPLFLDPFMTAPATRKRSESSKRWRDLKKSPMRIRPITSQ